MREKVFDRKERYLLLNHIFEHLKNDDEVAIKNIYEQYPDTNLSFVINKDSELELVDPGQGRENEEMFEWTLL